MPVAASCRFASAATVGFAGVTAMLSSAAAVTVNSVLPLTAPSVPLIVLVPALAACARPPALIVATAGLAEAQVTDDVRSAVDASE